MVFFKEVYLTGFTLFFRVAASAWPPHINALKGVFGVAFIQFITILGAYSWIDVLTKGRYFMDAHPLLDKIGALVVYFLNYLVLVRHGHGIAFERKFYELKNSKKIILVISFFLLTSCAIAFFLHFGIVHREFLGKH